MDRREIGDYGEQLAANYLCAQGWKILDRNWRCPAGELDIVAQDLAGTVVFCEVKSRRSLGFGEPLEAITVTKMYKLRELSIHWLRSQDHYTKHFRFDGIGVLLLANRPPQIVHKQGIGL